MKSFIHIVFATALSLLIAVQAMAAEKVNINTADAAAPVSYTHLTLPTTERV